MESGGSLYELLGVPIDADERMIRRAYRRLAMRFHPDRAKGADADGGVHFKRVKRAYETLVDPELRTVYDQAGERGLRQREEDGSGGAGGPAGFSAESLLRQMFSIPTPPCVGSDSVQGGTTEHTLHVTLEDLYLGRIRRFCVSRTVLRDGAETKPVQCDACIGAGKVLKDRMVGFGHRQNYFEVCSVCCGRGFSYPLVRKDEVVAVTVDPGMRHRAKIVLPKQADHTDPTVEPGDINVVLNQLPHKTFRREGDDLYMDVQISLGEALCGFELAVVHLDNRILCVQPVRGVVTRPGSIKAVLEEGMPIRRQTARGNLILRFDVVFPPDNSIGEWEREKLSRILPGTRPALGKRSREEQDFAETKTCVDFNEEKVGKLRTQESYDDSDGHNVRAFQSCCHQ